MHNCNYQLQSLKDRPKCIHVDKQTQYSN